MNINQLMISLAEKIVNCDPFIGLLILHYLDRLLDRHRGLIPLLSLIFRASCLFRLLPDRRVLGNVSVISIVLFHLKFSFHLFILSTLLFKTSKELFIQSRVVLLCWDIVFTFLSQWLMFEILKAEDRYRVLMMLLLRLN